MKVPSSDPSLKHTNKVGSRYDKDTLSPSFEQIADLVDMDCRYLIFLCFCQYVVAGVLHLN
jgi:hypothetical protein